MGMQDSELVGQIIQLPSAITFPNTVIKNIYIQKSMLDFHKVKDGLLDTSNGKNAPRFSCMSQELRASAKVISLFSN